MRLQSLDMASKNIKLYISCIIIAKAYCTSGNHDNLAFVTKIWLKESVSDKVINQDISFFRKDRKRDDLGGVCIYIKDGLYKYRRLNDLNCCDEHEVLWLPRGFTCLSHCDIPSTRSKRGIDSRSSLAVLYRGRIKISQLRHFNRMDTKCLIHFCLSQMVKVTTRKNATLDLMFTNMHEHYSPPQAYPHFGLSDHNAVVAIPINGKQQTNYKKIITRSDVRPSCKAAMGRCLSHLNWPLLFSSIEGVNEMWGVFQIVMHTGLDFIMSLNPYRHCRRCMVE